MEPTKIPLSRYYFVKSIYRLVGKWLTLLLTDGYFNLPFTRSYGAVTAFRDVRNKIKRAIRKARKAFMEKGLLSSISKEVQRMVHLVLSPYRQPLRFDPDKLNLHFASTAKRTLGVESTSVDEFFQLIRGLSDIYEDAFHFKNVTHREVLKTLKQLRMDCSTGTDQLPARFVKLAAEHLVGPITAIINNCISKLYFPHVWKVAHISPTPKVDTPVTVDHLPPVSILSVL